MKKEFIILDYSHFEELKNKVKFMEFYWMCYKKQHLKTEYSNEIVNQIQIIEHFIYSNRYREIKKVKCIFRNKKIKITKIKYEEINNYVVISNLLKDSIDL